MAQLVEHNLAKVGVAGSSPVVRSRLHRPRESGAFFFSRIIFYSVGRVYRGLKRKPLDCGVSGARRARCLRDSIEKARVPIAMCARARYRLHSLA